MNRLLLIAIMVLMPIAAWGSPPEYQFGGQGHYDVYLLNARARVTLGSFGLSASQLYGKTGGETTANEWRARIGYDRPLSWRWGGWADETAHRNRVDRYSENMLAAGLTYTAYMSGITSVKLSAGPMRHDLRRDDGHTETLTRLSARFNVERETEDTRAEFTAFHRANVEDRRDYLASAVLEFGLKQSKGRIVGIRLEDQYRSEGPRRHNVTWFFTLTLGGGK